MNTRILISILTIVAVVGGVSAATFAFFSDSGTNNDNVFATGTIDLKLTDGDESVLDNVTASFGGTNMVPGDSVSGFFQLKNSGSHEANHAEIDVVNVNSDLVNPLDKMLQITTLEYDTVDQIGQLNDVNLNGYVDLDDLENDPAFDGDSSDLDGLSLTDLATNHWLNMTVTFRSDAGNAYQGDSVDSDWTITLNQDVSQ